MTPDGPGRVWAVDHPGGKITVRVDGHPFPSRGAADTERRKCNRDCDSCGGGRHLLLWRDTPAWMSE